MEQMHVMAQAEAFAEEYLREIKPPLPPIARSLLVLGFYCGMSRGICQKAEQKAEAAERKLEAAR